MWCRTSIFVVSFYCADWNPKKLLSIYLTGFHSWQFAKAICLMVLWVSYSWIYIFGSMWMKVSDTLLKLFTLENLFEFVNILWDKSPKYLPSWITFIDIRVMHRFNSLLCSLANKNGWSWNLSYTSNKAFRSTSYEVLEY